MQDHLIANFFQADIDDGAIAIAPRVFQQIAHHATQQSRITGDFHRLRVELGIDARTFFGDQGG
ncbi:hypothetical protein D3C81_2095200 [compost metagenome]